LQNERNRFLLSFRQINRGDRVFSSVRSVRFVSEASRGGRTDYYYTFVSTCRFPPVTLSTVTNIVECSSRKVVVDCWLFYEEE
jgi:hypothetical protein